MKNATQTELDLVANSLTCEGEQRTISTPYTKHKLTPTTRAVLTAWARWAVENDCALAFCIAIDNEGLDRVGDPQYYTDGQISFDKLTSRLGQEWWASRE